MLRQITIATLAFALTACGDKQASTNTTPAKEYAVAAAHPLATEAGMKILEQGGSAVDAAYAIQAVLTLVEPQSSGFGGGAFMMFYDPSTDKIIAYDGREIAPASAKADMFMQDETTPMKFYDAVTSGRSVGVPGVVAMLSLAHEEHGKLPLNTILTPAYNLARDGFNITPRMHDTIERMSTQGKLATMEKAAEYFLDEEGKALPVGHLLKNPAYASTLSYLMEDGPATFYAGTVAEEIALAVNEIAGPGTMTIEDFINYRPQKREAVCQSYKEKELCSMPPPSSGGVTVLQILKTLEQTDFANKQPESAEAWHLLLEASRLAYADRAIFLGDLDGTGIDQDTVIKAMLLPAYIKDRAALIKEDRSSIEVQAGDPLSYLGEDTADLAKDTSPEPPSTSHFSVIDSEGRIVSMTSSVEFAFGSHIMAGGMILNNQLTDFSFKPVVDGKPSVNAPAAGKRPRSSMSPMILLNEDGSFYGALGSPGGSAIIGYVAKTLVAHFDWGYSLQNAIEAPNVVIPRGGVLVEDDTLDEVRLEDLKEFGHEIRERALSSGIYGFVKTPSGLEGGVDPRREGTFLKATKKEVHSE